MINAGLEQAVAILSQVKGNKQLREYFEKTVTPSYLKIKSNQNQIHTLEKLRDTLLPKLMSGEVRVKSRRDENFVITRTSQNKSSVGAKQKR